MSQGLAVSRHELLAIPGVMRAPWRSRTEIERRATDQVRALLSYATTHVPYYQARDEYRRPLRNLAELADLPIIDKNTVLDHGPENWHAPGMTARQFQTDRTSGTSGRVIEVRHDVRAYGYHGATVMRRFLVSGYRPWWRIVQFKPFPRPVRWFQRLGVFPRTVIDSALETSRLRDAALRARPHVLMGYPVVLRSFLRSLDDEQRAQLSRTLRLVLPDSELLTDQGRQVLERDFGVPVFDEYSAYEVLTMASQCRHGGMHIDEDRVWVEVLDEDGRPLPEGEEGDVVVTHFRERAMPLIRYRVGDRALHCPAGCPCGQRTSLLELRSGRTGEFVTLPDGRPIFPGTFLGVGMFTPGVAESMVHQDATGRITVSLVVDGRTGLSFDEVATEYHRRLEGHVGARVELDFREVDRVAITPGGKARFLTSEYSHADPGEV